MTVSKHSFSFRNITELPNPPYVRKYTYPLSFSHWVFCYKAIASADKDAAMEEAKAWLDETGHSGYLVWHDGSILPINRIGLIIDDDYKRWEG
jgi:hypothetical protein